MSRRPTPETEAAILASEGQWSFVLKETCQRLERERDEAREQLRIARDKCHQQRMIRLAGDKVYAEMCHEAEEQARLLAMSADREEKLRAALQRITECDMRWSKKVAREALQ